ncbi:Uncharacterized protein PCOAH_00051370 [Plasmodium coatneyi]|uniref:Plasmodium RESA N-terminal domain-containing protein n=1 Tax=Plasmodium coatneyi TaxID=208452 RepID=A0A1B1E892_9APIC|nr:Uncharacterized protein PCOAH_00051370 [Plasmodium coatneyi]ANQ10989.1 Uncharacterized protein PCOAH_00051370 [Plasmodium coatneyi]
MSSENAENKYIFWCTRSSVYLAAIIFLVLLNIFSFDGMSVSQTQICNRYLSNLCKNNNYKYNHSKSKNGKTNLVDTEVDSSCGTQKKNVATHYKTNEENDAAVKSSSVDIATMRKKCFKEHMHLTEKGLYHLVNTLEKVPYKCEMNSIWWQLRYIEARKFDNIENYVSEYLKVLGKKYKANDDFVDDKLEYCTEIIYKRRKHHEVFYNMRFYALLDRESFELKEFVDIINESRDSINKFKEELVETCKSLFTKKEEGKNAIIEKIIDSCFDNS